MDEWKDQKIKDGVEPPNLFHVTSGSVTSPKGFHAAGLACGIKGEELDLGLLYSEIPAVGAAVYTRNLFQAAPLLVTRDGLAREGRLQGVVVNSGNANACTGEQGLEDARKMQEAAAIRLGIPAHRTAVASTGVIGQFLPIEKVLKGISQASCHLRGGEDFARAIMTTDLREKTFQITLEVDGRQVIIAGAAKGSGMIHPNMATMLAFLTSDASVEEEALQALLRQAVDDSFNMMSVDGDTSTNDMVVVMANGLAGNKPLQPGHPDWMNFTRAFTLLCQELAQAIARDGEGAEHLLEVRVRGASHREMARAVAKSVVSSNLLKAAVFGADANWGRVVMAVGNSGQPLLPERVSVSLGEVAVVERGLPLPFDEASATNELKKERVLIAIDLSLGEAEAVAWGCDLTYDYVKINASYRS